MEVPEPSEPSEPRHSCVCGKTFAFSSGLSKHKKKCRRAGGGAGAAPDVGDVEENPPAPAVPSMPLETELTAETDDRKAMTIKAIDQLIAACPSAGIVRKCTLESSFAAVSKEHASVQRAVADHLNGMLFHRLLLTGCGAVESLSQLPPVKSRVDLQGFTQAVAADPGVQENLRLVMAQYPELVRLLTPEAKLGISLLTCAVSVAATNAAKKSTSPGSADGESESKP